ncbi:hypothetical protein [Microtetraspora fusca]|uniref:hypothetical protein n=1 Tax=Microtetraspora fusca TaxID=1997 RepID=UPI0012F722E0|nr:hypothetical protein [Microtetraspora fusca]
MAVVDSRGAVSPRSGTVNVVIYNDIVSPSPSIRCDVEYTSWPWDGGMTASIGITDTGPTTIAWMAAHGDRIDWPSGRAGREVRSVNDRNDRNHARLALS